MNMFQQNVPMIIFFQMSRYPRKWKTTNPTWLYGETKRPTYAQLSSNMNYINRFTYMNGNPALNLQTYTISLYQAVMIGFNLC